MEGKNRCSLEQHKEVNAIKYCPECKIYMCNKCESYHSSLFNNHHPYNLNKDEDIFTGYCKEKNHPNKLEYYCKSHNELCCANCIVKIQEIGDVLSNQNFFLTNIMILFHLLPFLYLQSLHNFLLFSILAF